MYGESHPHKQIILKLHQLLRDRILQPSYLGRVALIGVDMLAKIPMDAIVTGHRRRAAVNSNQRKGPDHVFSPERQLLVRAFMVHSLNVAANLERSAGKRPLLPRYGGHSELPLEVRQKERAELKKSERKQVVKIVVSDRTGFLAATVAAEVKAKGEQLEYSQPSNCIQHARDTLVLVSRVLEQQDTLKPAFRDLLIDKHDRSRRMIIIVIIIIIF